MSIEELRQKLIEELEAAYFVGGYGGAILEVEEVKKASPEELVEIAKRNGFQVEIVEEENQKHR